MKKKTAGFWILGVFKKYLPLVIIISVLGALTSLMGVGIILLTRDILNAAQANAIDTAFYENIIALAAIIILMILLNTFCSYLKSKAAAKIDMHLKNRMFRQLIRKEYSSLTKLHSGEIVNRFSSDIDHVVRGFANLIPTAISLCVKLIAGLAVIIYLEPLLAIVVLAVGFLLPLIARLLSKKYKNLHKESQRTDGVVRSFLQESIQNMIVIKTFEADSPVSNKLDGYLKDNYKIKMKRNILGTLMHTSLHGSFTIAYYGVIIWGAFAITLWGLEFGTFLAFLQLVSQLRTPLQNISGLIPQYYATIASAERLMEIEDIENEPISENALVDYSKLVSINGENLSFSYEGQTVLTDSNFTIKKGSTCAVMGESGTGKSTLFRLLLGLYHPTGRLFLKTEEGDVPLSAANRNLFSYVPQGALTLTGTIRENITFLSGEVSDEKIEVAAKQAVIYDFIKTLPQGFDTPIGERGIGLSEGQLQRIAIARALVTDSPVLLLDECTSALDTETECKLLENLKNTSDKTVILITHRPAALDICDTVLHVKDGKIEENK